MHASTTCPARNAVRTPIARAGALTLILAAMAILPAAAASGTDLVVNALALGPFATYSGLDSPPQTVTVTSTSSTVLTAITASALTNADLWRFTSRCPAELMPGESCEIDIRLSPPIGTTAVGLITAMRVSAFNALPSEAFQAGGRVELPIASPDPAQLAFSAIAGATSPPTAVTFTMSAGGAGPVALVFPPSAPVQLGTDECSGKNLQQGQSCQVLVAFAPPAGSGGTQYNTSISFQVDANLGDSKSRTTIATLLISGTSLTAATLTVARTGAGTGTVTSSPAGIDCGSACSADFVTGSTVALVPTPASGSFFAGWTGACTGTGACNVTMDAAKAVSAEFKLNTTIPRLANISTRMQVRTGNDVLIGGFIIGGAVPKTVVVRARGPSLIPFGITNALANPTMQLFSGQTVIATNDDFGSAANLAAINASGFAPSNSGEAAILATLAPGAYTAVVSGAGGTTGVGIIEVFEVDHPETPLANISTRGQVLTGNDVMIGGFVIQGDSPLTVVVRARGPSLVPFGIANALADPVLQLFAGQAILASNDDWQTSPDAAAITSRGFAPSDARESVILITLQPGAYTAIVSGKNGGTGVGIIEVFAQ